MEELALHKQIQQLLQEAHLLLNEKKNIRGAIATLEKLEKMDPENPLVLYNLAIAHAHCENYDSAKEYAIRCIALPMTFIDVKQVKKVYIYTLIQSEDYEKAFREIETNADLDEVLLQFEAFALEKMSNYNHALMIYERIYEKNSDNINVCNAIAYILANLPEGNLDRALELAKKAYQSDSHNAAYCDTIGYVYLKRGQLNMAKKYLKKAFAIKPDHREIRKHIAELLNIP